MATANVYKKLVLKKKDGSTVKIRYEDMPASRLGEVIQYYINYHLKNDVFVRAAGVPRTEESIKEYHEVTTRFLTSIVFKVVMCCIDNGSDSGNIIGIGTLMKYLKTDSMEEFAAQNPCRTKEVANLFNLWVTWDGHSKIQKTVDAHFAGPGTLVLPEYRGIGISEELLTLIEQVCKKDKVPMITQWMTTVENQKAAEKTHWKLSAEMKPEELEKKCNVTFEDKKTMLKYMYKHLN